MTPEHEAYLVGVRGVTPDTIKKFGLYTEGQSIAIPIDGAVKLYTPDGEPKMRWLQKVDPPVPPFPSFSALRNVELLVEGEFDAILAEQELGVPVGSTTLGANGWMDEWSDAIASGIGGTSGVTLLYDNDPPGDNGAKKAAESLRKYGVRVRIAHWPQDKPKGYDITEHFNSGGTTAELFAIIAAAKEELPPGLAHSLTDFIALDAGSNEMLVEGFLPAQAVVFTAGAPKSMKSLLTTELAFSVASGKPFLGRWQSGAPRRALIVQQESSMAAYQGRLRSAARRYGECDNLFVISNQHFDLMDEGSVEKLENELRRLRPTLTVLDPLASLHSGDENSAKDMGLLVRTLRRLRDQYGTTIIVVHHANKSSGHVATQRGGMRMRGSSALYASSEATISMERTEDEDANTSKVMVELKEGTGATPFQIHLEPSTCLLNAITPAQALREVVRGINQDIKQTYWNTGDAEMAEIPF